jgi:hypothetical protein
MRTIQPVTKYSSSRITELAPNDVEEILVAARNVLAECSRSSLRNPQSTRHLVSNGNLVA